jgi:hypothetical protein
LHQNPFEWIGVSDLTAERILAPAYHEGSEEAEQRTDAEEFLRELLADGRQEAAEVEKGSRAAKISDYALRRAKTALQVKTYKEGGEFGGKGAKWYWELPKAEEGDDKPIQGVEPSPQGVEKSRVQRLVANNDDKSTYSNNLPQGVESQVFNALCGNESTPCVTTDRKRVSI